MLSAMGSQVLDFLVFDRAAARYDDAAELTRFVAVYTGVLNAVDLAFLAVLAAWLLLRFGLRLGLVANPAAVTALTIAMLIAVLGPGPSSLALFAIVVTARIVDIALSDGMTRGSINAVFQVLPVEERMAVQASVEGIGVPVAIGATGVMLLVMNALDLGTSAIVAFALVLCAMWTVAAIVGYGDYRRALAARLRRRGLDVAVGAPRRRRGADGGTPAPAHRRRRRHPARPRSRRHGQPHGRRSRRPRQARRPRHPPAGARSTGPPG